MQHAEELILVYHEGLVVPFVRSGVHTGSLFGGPIEHEIRGVPFGPRGLHQFGVISERHLPKLAAKHKIPDLPLFYGLSFNDCRMSYTFDGDAVEVVSIEPAKSTENWPYPNYPANLPFVSLDVGKTRRQDWRDFAAQVVNLGEDQPSEIVAIVKPPATIGHSLWGRIGDAEGVTVVFECSPKTRTVVAYNVCD